jgi:ElaB/YqjD/DUF883 family membrane-anchored ribosome-binding protein
MADTIAKEKDTLAQELNQIVSNAEDLLRAAAASGGEKARALREEVGQDLDAWRTRIAELEQQAVRRARAAAQDTDAYVRANPWQAVGVAAALGALAGVVIAVLARSR